MSTRIWIIRRCLAYAAPQRRTAVVHQNIGKRILSKGSARYLSTPPPEDSEWNDDNSDGMERIKLDPRAPVLLNVQRLLQAKRLHPSDLRFKCADVMRDCVKIQTLDAMNRARKLMDRMIQEKRAHRILLSTKHFEVLLFGWAKLANQHPEAAIANMQEILKLMETEHDDDMKKELHTAVDDNDETSSWSCQPTALTFNTVLVGYANAARTFPDAAKQAEHILDVMMDHHERQGWYTKPNTRSYTQVITAYGNSGHVDAGNNAKRILDQMKSIHEAQKHAYEVDYNEAYNTINPEQNLKKIVTPDVMAYSAVISAYANCGTRESAESAQALLMEMVEAGNYDAIAFSATIDAWAKISSAKSSPKQRISAAENAEELFWLMQEIVQQTDQLADEKELQEADSEEDDVHEPPNKQDSLRTAVIALNASLNAWARSDTREAAPRAEALLQTVLETTMADKTAVKPDRVSFNSVLNAWARYSRYDRESPQKAEDLLTLMYELLQAGHLTEDAKPDAITYSTVINAWARAEKCPDRTKHARRLLDTMLDKFSSGEYDMKPSVVSFTSVINAATYSPACSSVLSAKETPEDWFTSSTGVAPDAYSIALQTYQELKDDTHELNICPDHFTYAVMLQLVGKHTDATSTERRHMIENIFDDACKNGEVSSFVIRALREVCPVDVMGRLLGRNYAKQLRSVNDLPKEWTRKVKWSQRFRAVDENSLDRRGKKKNQTTTTK